MYDSQNPLSHFFEQLNVAFGCVALILVVLVVHHASRPKPIPPYISPVRTTSIAGAATNTGTLRPLGNEIGRYLNSHAPKSSVYIEDLTTHQAVLVGEESGFAAKSLMKVPIVMDLYRTQELGTASLSDRVSLQESQLNNEYGDLWRKGAGYTLTLGEAADAALIHSDNTAVAVVNDTVIDKLAVPDMFVNVTHLDFYIPKVKPGQTEVAYITAASYASVFRCLYDSCFLSTEDSSKILGILSITNYRAPNRYLPETVVISHKIGDNLNLGFNDCGLVQSEETPFLFCILLTRGLPEASEDVAHIVKTSYEYLEH
jgi:beta-lactamase class A